MFMISKDKSLKGREQSIQDKTSKKHQSDPKRQVFREPNKNKHIPIFPSLSKSVSDLNSVGTVQSHPGTKVHHLIKSPGLHVISSELSVSSNRPQSRKGEHNFLFGNILHEPKRINK